MVCKTGTSLEGRSYWTVESLQRSNAGGNRTATLGFEHVHRERLEDSSFHTKIRIALFSHHLVRSRSPKATLSLSRDRQYLQVRFRPTGRARHIRTASDCLEALVAAVRYEIHTVLTDNVISVRRHSEEPQRTNRTVPGTSVRSVMLATRHRANPSIPGQWPGRADEPDNQGGNCQALSLRQPRPTAQTRLQYRLGI